MNDLRTTADVNRIANDVRELRFIEHTLQLAIQASLDVASHIVSDLRAQEPRTNAELFDRLASAGWLTQPLAQQLGRMAGFRNILVHGYDDVDLSIVVDVVTNRLGDLDAYVSAIRAKLSP